MAYRDELTEIGARVYGRSTNTETGQLGARIYGRCDETDSAQLGGRVYGHNDELDALGHRVYNPTHGEVVSYQQDDPADEEESRPWRLNESRPGPGAHYLDEAGQEDDLDAIGARIANGGGSGVAGIKSVDNRDEIGQVAGPYPYEF